MNLELLKKVKLFNFKFKPYIIYCKNQKNISDFGELTSISYSMAQQLLFKFPTDKLPKINLPKPKVSKLSFCPADIKYASTKLAHGWLTFSEYAKKCNLKTETVKKEAMAKKLGPVLTDPKSGKSIIIWPPEMQSKPLTELPKPGKKLFKVKYIGLAIGPDTLDSKDLKNFEKIQKSYIASAHAIGKTKNISKKANESLNKNNFLSQWIIFEVFLRSTIQELIKLHPNHLISGGKGKKFNLNYEEIFEMSNNFSSAENLKNRIIQKEIERIQEGGQSVHGLINFLKSEFSFKKDPYTNWYVFKGKHLNTHYDNLVEFKEVRNALIHDGGTPSKEFFKKYKNVPKYNDEIIITDDYYIRAMLILKTIAFSIAESIDKKEYNFN
jgi:hypothetical protein